MAALKQLNVAPKGMGLADFVAMKEGYFAAEGLDVASQPVVTGRFDPLFEAHLQNVERVRSRLESRGGVAYFDLAEWPLDAVNKFIGYYVDPAALYSVAVTASPRRAKVSVGSNPWRASERRHDLSKLCEKYGGGGHPVVGAVTLKGGEVEEARRIGREIAETLSG